MHRLRALYECQGADVNGRLLSSQRATGLEEGTYFLVPKDRTWPNALPRPRDLPKRPREQFIKRGGRLRNVLV